MGGCQINNPCDKEIIANHINPIVLNEINQSNNDINQEELKVSNEDIKIALPISPSSEISRIIFDKNKIKNLKYSKVN